MATSRSEGGVVASCAVTGAGSAIKAQANIVDTNTVNAGLAAGAHTLNRRRGMRPSFREAGQL
jgi:hypothetical protein